MSPLYNCSTAQLLFQSPRYSTGTSFRAKYGRQCVRECICSLHCSSGGGRGGVHLASLVRLQARCARHTHCVVVAAGWGRHVSRVPAKARRTWLRVSAALDKDRKRRGIVEVLWREAKSAKKGLLIQDSALRRHIAAPCLTRAPL
jgi:hypothetical protein